MCGVILSNGTTSLNFGNKDNMRIDPWQPDTAFLKSIDIHDLLPQREPFVMVDELTAFDNRYTSTETMVCSDNIFVDNNVFSPAGLIENIAQTCAARIGYVNKYILGKGIQIGLIGSIQNMEILALPMVGEVLNTTIDVEAEMFGMILVSARILCGEKVIATARVKIAQKEARAEIEKV